MTVDGNDVEAVDDAAAEAVERPGAAGADPDRGDDLPLQGPLKSDQNLYRTREEIESRRARDPIALREAVLRTLPRAWPPQGGP